MWQSAVAEVLFRNGQAAEVTLTPITLGYRWGRPDRGVPRLADAEFGARVLESLQKLSAPFGTKITVENGVGKIRLADTATGKTSAAAQ
jgi:poly-gamma-glutamate synthesis protein (capsule biosynthesis protein)